MLGCKIVEPDDWCRRCGCQGTFRDTVTSRLAHEPFGWRPTTLLVTVRRYRCGDCGHVWRQDSSSAAEPRAKLSRRGPRWALEAIVVHHLTMARIAEALAVDRSVGALVVEPVHPVEGLELVGGRGEVAIDQIGRASRQRVDDRGLDPFAPQRPLPAVSCHPPLDRAPRHLVPLPTQMQPHLPRTVADEEPLLPSLADQRFDLLITSARFDGSRLRAS